RRLRSDLSLLFTHRTMQSIYSSFFFNDTPTTEIYTLSLHDALPICMRASSSRVTPSTLSRRCARWRASSESTTGSSGGWGSSPRSEEHTSELQSLRHLVCRLLLEKKKKKDTAALNHVQTQQACYLVV